MASCCCYLLLQITKLIVYKHAMQNWWRCEVSIVFIKIFILRSSSLCSIRPIRWTPFLKELFMSKMLAVHIFSTEPYIKMFKLSLTAIFSNCLLDLVWAASIQTDICWQLIATAAWITVLKAVRFRQNTFLEHHRMWKMSKQLSERNIVEVLFMWYRCFPEVADNKQFKLIPN